VTAYTANCTNLMAGQILVTAITTPSQPATPAGPSTSCSGQVAVYSVSGTSAGDVLVWSLTPPNAGAITQTGVTASVTWEPDFTGNAALSVQAQNACGTSPPSAAATVMVNETPVPVVSGLQTVCEAWSCDYETPYNAGSTYDWVVAGGTVTGGAGTNVVTILWGPPGNGTVAVSETSTASCTGTSQILNILVTSCTGVGDAVDKEVIRVYPNPARDQFTIVFADKLSDNHILRLNDAIGRMVMELKIPAGATEVSNINIGRLPGGLFHLLVSKNNEIVFTKKILKL